MASNIIKFLILPSVEDVHVDQGILVNNIHVFIGTKRFDSEKAGDREVQRTMLELLNQMDGFQPNSQIKV